LSKKFFAIAKRKHSAAIATFFFSIEALIDACIEENFCSANFDSPLLLSKKGNFKAKMKKRIKFWQKDCNLCKYEGCPHLNAVAYKFPKV